MEKVRERQKQILEEVRSLESTESKAEALVENLDQRRMIEKKNYEASRKVLEKIQAARKKQLSLNSSIALKNQILEQKRQELTKRKEDIRRRQEACEAKFRSLLLRHSAETPSK